MKKNLLFVAALALSATTFAQTKWVCTAPTSDGKNIDGAANLSGTTTEANITVFDITWGTGMLEPTTCQKTHKDAAGNSIVYVDDNTALIKWVPSVAENATKDLTEAENAGQYVEFTAEISNNTDIMTIGSIEFDAVRTGTDAVRINVRLLANDGAYQSDWLITEENHSTVANSGTWVVSTGADDEILGCQPVREDNTKGDPYGTDAGLTHYNIPVPSDFPADAYQATLRIVVYGIASNKAVCYYNVTLNHGGGNAISTVDANAEVVAEQYYTVSGTEVAAPVKGINLVKQTLSNGTVKTVKVIR